MRAGARGRCRPCRDGRRPRRACRQADRDGQRPQPCRSLARFLSCARPRGRLRPSPQSGRESSSCASSRASRAPWSGRRAAARPRSGGNSADRSRPATCRCRVRLLLVHALALPVDPAADLGEGKLRRTRARCASRRWRARSRRARPAAASATCLRHSRGHGPSRAWRRDCRDRAVLQPMLDRGDGARDLARDEGLAADRALVVEQDAVGGVHAVGLAVVHRDPVGVELGRAHRGCADRTAWSRSAALPGPCRKARRSRPDRSATCCSELQDADRLEQAQRARARRHWRCIPAVSKLTCTWLCAARL